MSQVNYAIFIIGRANVSNTALGRYNGCWAWISGRPNYDGSIALTGAPTNPFTASAQTTWKQGMLIKDRVGSPTFRINMEEFGDYGTSGDLSFDLDNTGGLADAFQLDEDTLFRCEVRFYVVIGNTFTLAWTGVVDDISERGAELSVRCVDAYREIHKEFPPATVESSIYPMARDTVLGKTIPVCMGRVAHAALLNVGGKSSPLDVYKTGGVTYKATAAVSSAAPTITNRYQTVTLITGSLPIAENAFAGRWLAVIRGGPSQAVKITGNTASDGSLQSSIVVYLDGFFHNGSKDQAASVTARGGGSSSINLDSWWFQVLETSFPRLVSDRAVYSIEKGADGATERLESYDKDTELWADIGSLKHKVSATAVEQGGGRPGFLIYSRDINDTASKLTTTKPIRPSAVSVYSTDYGWTSYSTKTGLTVLTALPAGTYSELRDIDQSTNKAFSIRRGTSLTNGAVLMKVILDLSFDELPFTTGYEEVNLAMRVGLTGSGAWPSQPVGVVLAGNVYGVDVIGSGGISTPLITFSGLSLPTQNANIPSRVGKFYTANWASAQTVLIDGIDPKYYDDESLGNGPAKQDQRLVLNVSRIFDKPKSFNPYRKIRVELEAFFDGGTLWSGSTTTDLTLNIYEIMLAGTRSVDAAPEEAATKVKGQMFSDTWGGRKTTGNPIESPVDAVEYLIREYDGKPDAIDTASFDEAYLSRLPEDWWVSRQITDRKPSHEYIRELCHQAWLFVAPGPDGKRKIIARPYTYVGQPVFNASNIKSGSLSQVVRTSLRKCYNEFDLSYNWDPGAKRYRNRVVITRVNESAFPASDEMEGTAASITVINYIRDGFSNRIQCVTSSPVPVKAGDYVQLVGGANGVAFNAKKVLSTYSHNLNAWAGAQHGFYIDADGCGALVSSTSYNTGTWTRHRDAVLKWKKFVQGIDDYSFASGFWGLCNEKYLQTRTINALKEEFKWFGTEEDWGGDSDDDPVLQWLLKTIIFLGSPRKKGTFRLGVASAHLSYYPSQPCTINDAKWTGGVDTNAHIHSITIKPETDEVEIGVTWI